MTGELGRAFSKLRCMVRARPIEEEGGIGAGEPSVSIQHKVYISNVSIYNKMHVLYFQVVIHMRHIQSHT